MVVKNEGPGDPMVRGVNLEPEEPASNDSAVYVGLPGLEAQEANDIDPATRSAVSLARVRPLPPSSRRSPLAARVSPGNKTPARAGDCQAGDGKRVHEEGASVPDQEVERGGDVVVGNMHRHLRHL